MSVAVAVFCYNRSYHVSKVLEALSHNTVLPEKLYIFQDGMKDSTDVVEWNKVSEIIKQVDWCDTEVIIQSNNKGLSDSIVGGVSMILEKYEAIVVLEDDCVPHREFMRFMLEGLTRYRKNERIYCVTGCAEEVDVEKDDYDVYFMHRGSSLGWGTWANRWEKYKRDYLLIKQIRRDPIKRQRLEDWGPDLKNVLVSNIEERTDSWAVFWDLTIINHGGYTVVPYESLIDNIGFDGTGIHSNIRTFNIKLKKDGIIDEFTFPPNVIAKDTILKAFKFHYTRLSELEKEVFYNNCLKKWLEFKIQGKQLRDTLIDYEKIAIWGIGDLCKLLVLELKDIGKIKCIIMTDADRNMYEGIPVVSPEKLKEEFDLIIIIPAFAIKKIERSCEINQIFSKIIGVDELFESINLIDRI